MHDSSMKVLVALRETIQHWHTWPYNSAKYVICNATCMPIIVTVVLLQTLSNLCNLHNAESATTSLTKAQPTTMSLQLGASWHEIPRDKNRDATHLCHDCQWRIFRLVGHDGYPKAHGHHGMYTYSWSPTQIHYYSLHIPSRGLINWKHHHVDHSTHNSALSKCLNAPKCHIFTSKCKDAFITVCSSRQR